MKLFNVDWDGTILDTELAKAASWLLPALFVLGILSRSLFDAIKETARIDGLLEMLRNHETELQAIQDLKGRSRTDTAIAVCTRLKLRSTPEELTEKRNEIRASLLEAMTMPIGGAVDFLENGHAKGLMFAVVTQTTREDVEDQIGRYHIPNVFSQLACAGDPAYSDLPGDAKSVAHERVCHHFGVRPDEVVAIDDTEAGIRSARAIGIPTIAVTSSPENRIPIADMNVHPDLGSLAHEDIFDLFLENSPYEALSLTRRLLGDKAS